MAKEEQQQKKLKLVKQSNSSKSVKKKLKTEKTKKKIKLSDSDSESSPENIESLLEPFSKDQLIAIAVDAALRHPSLVSVIRSAADSDVSHRKIFVFGLGFDTTRETLVSVFESYGEIESCNIVTDRVTGRCKGYGFVIFRTRKGAAKVLKEPKKRIGNRIASCQLASTGSSVNVSLPGSGQSELSGRKIYVSNVLPDVDGKRLRDFFARFGEVESGPLGMDPNTGKWKGYALFVYKTAEQAKKCLEEPYKMFEGRKLYCQKAAEKKIGGKFGGGAAGITTAVVQQPFQPLQAGPGPDMLAALAAAQNLAMVGQNPNAAFLNPLYSGLLMNPSLGMFNPVMGMGGLGQGVVGSGQGAGPSSGHPAVAGGGSYGSTMVLGNYGIDVEGSEKSSSGMQKGLLHAYPSAKDPMSSGYISHFWYDIIYLTFKYLIASFINIFYARIIDTVLPLLFNSLV